MIDITKEDDENDDEDDENEENVATNVLTDTIKFSVGALRPNFLALCQPSINVAAIKWSAFVACSVLACMAGLVLASRINSVDPQTGGNDFLLKAIGAAVIGGTSLFGGVGSVVGSIFGVLSIKIIENCINLLGVSYHLYLAVQGAIILVAIIAGNLTNRRA